MAVHPLGCVPSPYMCTAAIHAVASTHLHACMHCVWWTPPAPSPTTRRQGAIVQEVMEEHRMEPAFVATGGLLGALMLVLLAGVYYARTLHTLLTTMRDKQASKTK
jgi:hypothetical protein